MQKNGDYYYYYDYCYYMKHLLGPEPFTTVRVRVRVLPKQNKERQIQIIDNKAKFNSKCKNKKLRSKTYHEDRRQRKLPGEHHTNTHSKLTNTRRKTRTVYTDTNDKTRDR